MAYSLALPDKSPSAVDALPTTPVQTAHAADHSLSPDQNA